MRAYLNRWIQPDTIVPDFSNPQSLNRFSYVRNNPLGFTDPSGHRECATTDSAVCSEADLIEQARLLRLQATILYGITFAGSGWDYERIDAVVNAASTIGNALVPGYRHAVAADLANARQLAGLRENRRLGSTVDDFRELVDLDSPGEIFGAVYRGVTFRHVDENNPNGWAFTRVPVIRVYNGAFNDAQIEHFTWHFPAHELGHAFSQRAGRVPYNDLAAAGLGALVTEGAWHQRREDMNSEYFADAFLGWAGNHLVANWNDWMNANMPRWIALAVTGNR